MKRRRVLFIARTVNGGKSIRIITFDFLGYTFQPRGQRNKQGQVFNGYAPAISRKSKKRITETMRGWHLNRRVQLKLSDIAVEINAEVRGWMNYYGKFYGSQLKAFLQCVNLKLARWAERKYKRFRRKPNDAYKWLVRVASKAGLGAHACHHSIWEGDTSVIHHHHHHHHF